jgi:hypothetical protein
VGPAGPKNEGQTPDVWSYGPDPKNKSKAVGSRPAEAKPADGKRPKG